MTSIGPTLMTARLIPRPPRHEDFDGFASMARGEDTPALDRLPRSAARV